MDKELEDVRYDFTIINYIYIFFILKIYEQVINLIQRAMENWIMELKFSGQKIKQG